VQSLQRRPQRLGALRQLIRRARAASASLVPHDEAELFQIFESLNQHLLAQVRQPGVQLAVAERAVLQVREDDGLPFAAENLDGELDTAGKSTLKAMGPWRSLDYRFCDRAVWPAHTMRTLLGNGSPLARSDQVWPVSVET